jgi:hypothetical protein
MLVMLGCPGGGGGGSLVDGFERGLTVVGGCADVVAYAVDDEDSVLLQVALDGPLAAAPREPATTVYTQPDVAASVAVTVGTNVSDAVCDDVIEDGGPTVTETWTAVAGTVTIDIRPDDADDRADVTIENVVLESLDGDRVIVDRFEWTDLAVGWFPG